MYALGIDLGTTWTAAAVWRDGRAEIATLGASAFSVPSVVLAEPDGELVVGEAAAARALSSPQLVAREFKRRFGQDVPYLLGDREISPAQLTGALLSWVLRTVTAREGEPPGRVALTVPATWGAHLVDSLVEVAAAAGAPEAVIVREPAAAAIHYAARTRVTAGTTIGVYDFGGGTFDAAVLRKTATGFELLGTPEGDGRLGGSDLDDVLLRDVTAQLDGFASLDRRDPAVRAALAALRVSVTRARETLSEATSAVVPVTLPGRNREITVTRQRLDQLCAPLVMRSAEVFEDAVAMAGLAVSDLDVVLLVGGASRTPLVARTILGRFGLEASTDAHPKSAVCLGAAITAGAALASMPAVAPPSTPAPTQAAPQPPAPQPPGPAAPQPPVPAAPQAAPQTKPQAPVPVQPGAAPVPPGAVPPAGVPDPKPAAPEPVAPEPPGPEPTGPEPTGPEPTGPEPSGPEPSGPQPTGPEPSGPQPSRPEPGWADPWSRPAWPQQQPPEAPRARPAPAQPAPAWPAPTRPAPEQETPAGPAPVPQQQPEPVAAREQQPAPSDPSWDDPSWADLVGRAQERPQEGPQELQLERVRLAPVQPAAGLPTVPAQATGQRWAPSLELSLNDSPTQPIPRLSARTMELPVVAQEPDYVVVDLISAGLSTVDEVPTRPAVPLPPRLRAQAADQALVDLSDRGYRDQARRSAVTVVAVVGTVLAAIALLGILTRM